jgi:actin-related protein 6
VLTPFALHSHAVPVFDGRVQLAGVRRINIGGKALTNHLKELVSYRCVVVA